MFSKICPHCGGVSYSAAGLGAWACPYCGKDISFVSVTPAGVNHPMMKVPSGMSRVDNLIYLDQKKKQPK